MLFQDGKSRCSFFVSVLLLTRIAWASAARGIFSPPGLPRRTIWTEALSDGNETRHGLASLSTTLIAVPDNFTAISAECRSALNANVSCSALITDPSALYTWGGLSLDEITTLCAAECSSSIASYRKKVVSACSNDVYTDLKDNGTAVVQGTGVKDDIYNIEDVSVQPIAFADYYILNYKLLCQQDNSTPPQYCYQITGNGTRNNTVDPCGNCGLGAMRLLLEDARTYDESLADDYSASVKSCGVTVAPVTTPSPVFLDTSNTIVSGYNTTRTCTGSMVAIETAASCDTVAKNHMVSTDSLLMANGLAANCADWPGGLKTVCIEGSCKTHTVTKNDTCPDMANINNITITQLTSWNPTLDPLCKTLESHIGHVICVSDPRNYTVVAIGPGSGGEANPTTKAPTPTDAAKGSNTRCGKWYSVQPLDYCELVCNKNGITLDDFYFLNPEINSNCTNLSLGSSYCIAAVGNIATYPGYGGNPSTTEAQPTSWIPANTATTVSSVSYPDPSATGYPLANGSIPDCAEVFENEYGNLTCQEAAWWTNVVVTDWVRWNPSVLNGGNYSIDTCILQNETSYCGSFYNQSLVPSPADPFTQYIPPPENSTANATDKCIDWYLTQTGDTCDKICQHHDIPFSSFFSWNPAIGKDCTNLWLDAEYCVAGPGFQNVHYPWPTTTSGGPPGPTQTGIAKKCNAWYLAKSGDTCTSIAKKKGITVAKFEKWNPAVGSDCSKLLAGDAYCIGVKGTGTVTTTKTTTTKTSTKKPTGTTVKPPGPTQSGISKKCNKYAIAAKGSTCIKFAKKHDITKAQLYKWNKVLDDDSCANKFWAGEAYCIGVSS